MELPNILLTLGDPAGIGPEVVSKVLKNGSVRRFARLTIVGDIRFLKGVPLSSKVNFINIPSCFTKIKPGRISSFSGEASYQWVLKAAEIALAKKVDAVVTMPISKAAFRLAGRMYEGHTELLAELCGTKKFSMMMCAGSVRAVMATRHLPLSAVSSKIRKAQIVDTVITTNKFIKDRYRIENPVITVCALNPHSGERGLLGDEEAKEIIPAIKELAKLGIKAAGPIPADSAWCNAKDGGCDLLVCMYHDQAMIGLKCLDASKVVNVTCGLPFIRTSPGHGTAEDIAGKRKADPSATIEAIRVAAELCKWN